jgi:hypothetical protein
MMGIAKSMMGWLEKLGEKGIALMLMVSLRFRHELPVSLDRSLHRIADLNNNE